MLRILSFIYTLFEYFIIWAGIIFLGNSFPSPGFKNEVYLPWQSRAYFGKRSHILLLTANSERHHSCGLVA